MIDGITTTWKFVTTHSPRESARWLLSKDAPGIVQFFKYGLCGVAATIAHQAVTLGLAYTIIPAIDGMLVDGEPIGDALRKKNLLINNCAGAFFGMLVAYITNILWVFRDGRHSRLVEFLLFFSVGLASFGSGLWVIAFLIDQWGVHSLIAQVGFLITSVLVNFVCRKLFIFHG